MLFKGNAEVGYDRVRMKRIFQQYIRGLDIPMNNAKPMQIEKSICDLSKNLFRSFFFYLRPSIFHAFLIILDCATLNEFRDHIEMLVVFYRLMKADNVPTLFKSRFSQALNLLEPRIIVRMKTLDGLLVDNFDGIQ